MVMSIKVLIMMLMITVRMMILIEPVMLPFLFFVSVQTNVKLSFLRMKYQN